MFWLIYDNTGGPAQVSNTNFNFLFLVTLTIDIKTILLMAILGMMISFESNMQSKGHLGLTYLYMDLVKTKEGMQCMLLSA